MAVIADSVARSQFNTAIKEIRERLRGLSGSGTIRKWHRIGVPLKAQSVLWWLIEMDSSPCIYWSAREGSFECGGFGTARTIEGKSQEQLLENLEQELSRVGCGSRYYGGLRFDSEPASSVWRAFGAGYFVLPRFEIVRNDAGCSLVVNVTPGDSHEDIDALSASLDTLGQAVGDDDDAMPGIVSRVDTPNRERWTDIIESALAAFRVGKYDKIVLARQSTVTFTDRVHPLKLLSRLKQRSAGCFHFCFRPEPGVAFIGASPELLYHRNGNCLLTEAMAGTRPRGETETDDARIGSELLSSVKDRIEHRYVIESIADALSPLVRGPIDADRPEVGLRKLARVQHLCAEMEATIRDGTSEGDIVRALHPTAAVGGYPKDRVTGEISSLENFDRGWYAAPVGWVGVDDAEFAVAIRSGLVSGNVLRLYSGAGIVDGSDAEQEWEEIESKLSNFIKALS